MPRCPTCRCAENARPDRATARMELAPARLHRLPARPRLRRQGHRATSTSGARPGATAPRAACRAAICRSSSSAARCCRRPAVLVVSQPTWGVDAGAAAAIHQALLSIWPQAARPWWSSRRTSTSCSRSATRIAVIAGGRAVAAAAGRRQLTDRGDRPADGRRTAPRPTAGSRRMLRLEPRREPSQAMFYLTPLLAVVLTMLAGARAVRDPRQDRRSRRCG